MFLFKSKTVENEQVKDDERKEEKEEEEEVKPSLFQNFSFFHPPSFTPEDVAIMVNLISGVTRRGALTIDEIKVISPLYQKLCRVVSNEKSWFITEEYELEDSLSGAQTSPEVSEDEDASSVKSAGPRSGRGGKKKKKNNRKKR